MKSILVNRTLVVSKFHFAIHPLHLKLKRGLTKVFLWPSIFFWLLEKGASMVKWTTNVLQYINTIFFGQRPKNNSKALIKLNWISWWPLLLCCILKCRISSWYLQYLSLKVMFKNKWLGLVLEVDFMTLTNLKFKFSFMFLEFNMYLRAWSQNFVKNHQFDVILSYFKHFLDNHLFNITYLHTTCTVL